MLGATKSSRREGSGNRRGQAIRAARLWRLGNQTIADVEGISMIGRRDIGSGVIPTDRPFLSALR